MRSPYGHDMRDVSTLHAVLIGLVVKGRFKPMMRSVFLLEMQWELSGSRDHYQHIINMTRAKK